MSHPVNKSEKLARGTARRDRERHPVCFTPLSSVPEVPNHLNSDATEFFIYVCELLLSNGSLTAGNIPDITLAAIWWGVAREAEKQVKENGIVQTFSTGSIQISPYLSSLEKATVQIQRFSDRYGLSLLSRQRVGVKEKKDDDPFDGI